MPCAYSGVQKSSSLQSGPFFHIHNTFYSIYERVRAASFAYASHLKDTSVKLKTLLLQKRKG